MSLPTPSIPPNKRIPFSGPNRQCILAVERPATGMYMATLVNQSIESNIMSYTPVFKTIARATSVFSTNNPAGVDRESLPVTIVDLTFNEVTRSIEVTCSDKRKRQCRIDRLNSDKLVKSLQMSLQKAYTMQTPIQFIAAGGNDPQVWFYTVK
jgi:hypothetical protein